MATTYQDVSNNNGLLIFQIDRVKIKRGYERVIHQINLNNLKNNIIHIENLANKINVTTHLTNTFDYKLKLSYRKIDNLLPKRTRRGLINILGSAVKFIAGNPDYDDLLLINQNFEAQETNINKIISNESKQIKINNLLEQQVNKVSETLSNIKQSMQTTQNELNIVNLIFNLDIIIRMLEDLEEQVLLSKSNLINKNILGFREKEYIWNFLTQQNLKLTYEDEIFVHISSIVVIKDNQFIVIAKIPIVENRDYELLKLETIGRNGTRINTDVKYVARHKNRLFKQVSRCTICDETNPLTDECIFNILNNLQAKCSFSKQSEHPEFREILPGTILVDTATGVQVTDSCGDSRIIATPTVVETENCTIRIENSTFDNNYKRIEQIQFMTPIFGKVIEAETETPSIETLHSISLDNLEELHKVKMHLIKTQTFGGSVLILLMVSAILLFYIHRYFKTKRTINKPNSPELQLQLEAIHPITTMEEDSSTINITESSEVSHGTENTKKGVNLEPRFVLLKNTRSHPRTPDT